MQNLYEKYIISNRMRPFRTFIMKFTETDFSVHDEYELIYVLEGKIDVKTAHYAKRLVKGDMVIINSQAVHSVNPIEGDCTALVMQIQSDYLNQYARLDKTKRMMFHNEVKIDSLESKYFLMNYIRLHNKASDYDLSLDYQLETFTKSLMNFYDKTIDLHENMDYRYIEDVNYLIQDIVIDLYNHRGSPEHLTLTYFSKKYLINYSYLSRLFYQETGIGFQRYVQNQKINGAIVFLLNTEKTIQEISQRTGYTSSEALWKDFVHEFGMSPTEFRKTGEKYILDRQNQYSKEIEKQYYYLRKEIEEIQSENSRIVKFDKSQKGYLRILPFYVANDDIEELIFEDEFHVLDRRIIIPILAKKNQEICLTNIRQKSLEDLKSMQKEFIFWLRFDSEFVYTEQRLEEILKKIKAKLNLSNQVIHILVDTTMLSSTAERKFLSDWIQAKNKEEKSAKFYELESFQFNELGYYKVKGVEESEVAYLNVEIDFNFEESKNARQFERVISHNDYEEKHLYISLNLIWDFAVPFEFQLAESLAIRYLFKMIHTVQKPITIVEMNFLHKEKQYRIDQLHLNQIPTNFYYVMSFFQNLNDHYYYDKKGIYYSLNNDGGYFIFCPQPITISHGASTNHYLDVETKSIEGSYIFNVYSLDLTTSIYEYKDIIEDLEKEEIRAMRNQYLPDFEKRKITLFDKHFFQLDQGWYRFVYLDFKQG